MTPELDSAFAIAAAALCGAAVGVERQWSGHASGPEGRFAGIRTFTLFGGVAGAAGRIALAGQPLLAALLLLGATGLVVAGYVAASRREVDATTEVAALVVLAAGLLAGLGYTVLASGVTAVTILLLVEKRRLHAWVGLIQDEEIRAGARFAVMALVVLPLLPEGPFGPLGGIRPRELWALVLLFSGLSFVGTVLRRLVRGERGYAIAGAIGGLISSTAVTASYARTSAGAAHLSRALASGVAAAAAVMIVRVIVVSTVLDPTLGRSAAGLLALPLLVAVGAAAVLARRASIPVAAETAPPRNPLALRQALQLAALFQLVLYLVWAARAYFADVGVLLSAALVGLTDVDAIVLAMARQGGGTPPPLGGLALVVAVLSNSAFKLGLSLAWGAGRFRPLVAASLGAVVLACAVPLALALLRG